MLISQRNELQSYLESFVIPKIGGNKEPELKAFVKELLLDKSLASGNGGDDSTTMLRMLRAAHRLDQKRPPENETKSMIVWISRLLLDLCQTEADQDILFKNVRQITNTNYNEE